VILLDQGIAYIPIRTFLEMDPEYISTPIESKASDVLRICGFGWVRVVAAQIVTAAAGVILVLRVHALYPRNVLVTIGLILVYLAQNAVAIVSLVKDTYVPSMKFFTADDEITLARRSSCPSMDSFTIFGFIPVGSSYGLIAEGSLGGASSGLLALFCSAISFDFIIFVLTGIRAYRSYKDSISSTHIFGVIFRDGNIYFISLFLTNTLFAILISMNSDSRIFVGTSSVQLSAVLIAVLTSSLFMNLREAAHHTRMGSEKPLELTSLGAWDAASRYMSTDDKHLTHTATSITRGRIMMESTFDHIMGYCDFAVELSGWGEDDGEDSSTEFPQSRPISIEDADSHRTIYP